MSAAPRVPPASSALAGPAASRRQVWIHLLLYPGHTLPTAAAPILVGVGLAHRDGVRALGPALVAFLCSWMVHCGGVFLDQYLLLARHPGLREHPELDDAVAAGWLRLPALRALAILWFVGALVPGVYLLRVIGGQGQWPTMQRAIECLWQAKVVARNIVTLAAQPAEYPQGVPPLVPHVLRPTFAYGVSLGRHSLVVYGAARVDVPVVNVWFRRWLMRQYFARYAPRG